MSQSEENAAYAVFLAKFTELNCMYVNRWPREMIEPEILNLCVLRDKLTPSRIKSAKRLMKRLHERHKEWESCRHVSAN